MRRVYLILFFVFILFAQLYAQQTATEFSKKLDVLKKNNDLSGWIDDRVNYTAELPKERLSFLMATNKQAWRKAVSPEEKEAWLFLLINQGYFQLVDGDILASINCYEQAYDYHQKNQLSLDVEEYILKPLANNYTRLGDYERAIYIQNRSLQLAISQKNNDLAASAYCNLSTSYRSKNDLINAEKCVIKGLAIANTESDIYGLLLSSKADIENENRQYKAANQSITKAIQHLKKSKTNHLTAYWLLSAYTLAGDIQFNIQDYTGAENYYQNADQTLNHFFKDGRNREHAYISTQIGKLNIKQRKYIKALSYFNNALEILIPNFKVLRKEDLPTASSLYAENKLQAALTGKSEVLEKLGLLDAALKAEILAFTVSEKLRSEFTYTTSKQQLQAEAKILAESIIEKSYQLWLKTKDKTYTENILLLSEKTKARILLDEITDHEEKNVSIKNNPIYAEKLNIERSLAFYGKQLQENNQASIQKKITDLKFRLSSLQKQLNIKNSEINIDVKQMLRKISKNTKAIIFFSGNKNNYRIEIDQQKIIQVYKIENAEELNSKINSFMSGYFYNGPEEMINQPKKFYQDSHYIFNRLFAQTTLNKHQNLLIIKDGVLNFLPFESLITTNNYSQNIAKWSFLIKLVPISYAFSIHAIHQEHKKDTSTLEKFTGIFLSNTGSGKNEIPAVVSEFNGLKKIIAGNFFKNQDASISNFKKALSSSDVLHISSHSYLTDSLQEPVMELYKSRFYLLELGAQQKVPDLVVLSACQTADGAFISGEGVLSLSRGFIAAGAKGVISSLWKVNDESAAHLMQDYYQNLLHSKHSESSLRAAKLNWLKQQQNKVLLLPYYWDSLIYTGIEQNINLEKKVNYYPYLIISLILLLVAMGFIAFRKKKIKHSPNQ